MAMDLQITFEPGISGLTVSRLIMTVGDASVRSYPMSAEDHYRDLFAIRHFLSRRTLTSIMLGNEPVAAIEFSNEGDVVTLKPYKRLEGIAFSDNFHLSQGIGQIDQALDNLSAVISTDRAFLERQTFEDIDAGVYDRCETETGEARLKE
jgi:hypothetical protein